MAFWKRYAATSRARPKPIGCALRRPGCSTSTSTGRPRRCWKAGTTGSPLEPWQLDVLDYLDRRRVAARPGDCLLPELFQAMREQHADLTMSAFHEGLGRLRDRGAIVLVPFDGHLSELSEPEYALLEGAAVFYGVKRT